MGRVQSLVPGCARTRYHHHPRCRTHAQSSLPTPCQPPTLNKSSFPVRLRGCAMSTIGGGASRAGQRCRTSLGRAWSRRHTTRSTRHAKRKGGRWQRFMPSSPPLMLLIEKGAGACRQMQRIKGTRRPHQARRCCGLALPTLPLWVVKTVRQCRCVASGWCWSLLMLRPQAAVW